MADIERKGKDVVDESGTSDPVEHEEGGPETPQEPGGLPGEEPQEEPEEEEEEEDAEDSAPTPKGPRTGKALPKLDSTGGKALEPRKRDYYDPEPVPLWDPSELYRWSLWRAGIAEFVGTLLLLFVGLSVAVGATANDGVAHVGVGDVGIALTFGFTVFAIVYATAGVSGGHINTAITFGMLVARKISLLRALLYMILQVLGALCGAGLVKALQKGYYQRYGGGANFVQHGYSKGAGFTAEMLGTFFLLYIVLSATDPKRKARDSHIPILAPFAIGMTILVVHLAIIPITGCGINPARSFAAASLWDHHAHAWHDHWIFWVAPLLGAAEAAIYQQIVMRARPFRYLPEILNARGDNDGDHEHDV